MLVLGGKMELKYHIRQLLLRGLSILLADGLLAFLNPLVVGFIHSLMRKERVLRVVKRGIKILLKKGSGYSLKRQYLMVL
jgi:hypothetical protein